MKLAAADIPKPWRAPWTLLLFVGGVAAIALGGYAALDARIAHVAESAISQKWSDTYQSSALKACTAAADQGAYRAVSEAMQQVVLPLQRRVDEHLAKDDQRVAELDRRVTTLESHRR